MTYSDTSELPILSAKKLESFAASLAGMQYKVVIVYGMPDRDAAVLADDLAKATLSQGWDTTSSMRFVPPQIDSAIVIAVRSKEISRTIEAQQLAAALDQAIGSEVPRVIDPAIPDTEIDILLSSRPVRRPK